jgi:hypothetical protein
MKTGGFLYYPVEPYVMEGHAGAGPRRTVRPRHSHPVGRLSEAASVRREVPRMSVHGLLELISRILSTVWLWHLDDAGFDPEAILIEIDSKRRDRISS